jgi:short-subunit dehydrogenase involved in D-alanine esterification of teichoic acids
LRFLAINSGLANTSVWILPIYNATKPISVKTSPIRKVFATTNIAKGV